jgi:hypothetical protein
LFDQAAHGTQFVHHLDLLGGAPADGRTIRGDIDAKELERGGQGGSHEVRVRR